MDHEPFFDRLPDDEWFDAVALVGTDGAPIVTIITAPRFKTSELSGDEWRIAGQIHIANEDPSQPLSTYGNVETCCQALYPNLHYHRRELLESAVIAITEFRRKGVTLYGAHDEGKPSPLSVAAACLPWAWITAREGGMRPKDVDDWCFQPGCSQRAVSTYRLKQLFSLQGDGPLESKPWATQRRFCSLHLNRGDSSRSDSNDNYEVVDGPGPDQASHARHEFDRPAIFAGAIELPRQRKETG